MTGPVPVRPAAVLYGDDAVFDRLFDDELLARLDTLLATGRPRHLTRLDTAPARARLADAEVLVTGWGCPPVTEADLAAAPRLRAVFHAGGSVKGVLPSGAWTRDLVVTSGAAANAVPVAEYTLAAILFAGKRVPEYAARQRDRPGDPGVYGELPVPGNHRRTVGVVGLSRTGRRLLDLLRPFDLRALVADPYADPADAAAYGAELVDLETLLAAADVVTLHAPALPATRHLLDARRLALLPDGATVVNTARGSLVDTAALTRECIGGRLRAVLDVTDPEPLPADSPLHRLPNVLLTPHLAGAMGGETRRIGELTVDEIGRYVRGEALRHRVHHGDLARIA
ncbi:hydroxyacid dehydrogenase [Polymorphospora rubra]|uniref:Glycerate dehydrogenase n=1 Tax=Polymorphospora rubra TaxID=338584 RepID=A0A810NAF0_9ACTN|nr:hydroxyacid dehydrogenase [Polymorphospora rubra]BCJ70197.1 glycerate dehydrogenase [Polymorphospora rubra]